MMNRRFMVLGAILAALIQTGLIGQMIWARAAILKDGVEVRLQTGFVDPRDLFRGHYVTLNLLISTIDATKVTRDGDFRHGDPIWVVLAEGDDGFWHPDAVLHGPAPDRVALRGTFRSDYGGEIRVSFPFDRYFAPRERALELEDLRRDQRLGVILAVTPDGQGAVKGITIDGEVIYDEPLL